MTHNPKHAPEQLTAEEELESLREHNEKMRWLLDRMLIRKAIFQPPTAEQWDEAYRLTREPEQPEEEDDECHGDAWAREHRLTAHELGLK